MHIRSLMLASMAALAMSGAAFAACGTTAMNGEPLDPTRWGPNWCNPPSLTPNTGGAGLGPVLPVVVVPPVVPVDPVDPVDPPTEVPSTPLTPATPNPGVYSGTLVGTPYEGTPAGPVTGFVLSSDFTLPNGTTIPAGTYSGQIAPNGMFVVKAD